MGATFACSGVAATSLSLSLAVEAVTAGGWLAVVDLPWVGIEAAAELGVALERLVRVDGGSWAETVAALVDGFELVVTRPPARTSAATVRKVQTRVQARKRCSCSSTSRPDASPAHRSTSCSPPPGPPGTASPTATVASRCAASMSSPPGDGSPEPRRATPWLPGPTGALAATEQPDLVTLVLESAHQDDQIAV